MQVARLGGLIVAASLAMGASSASAVEVWSVQDGRTTLHFNTDLMQNLGLELTRVNESMPEPTAPVLMEGPHWNFRLDQASQLSFEVQDGVRQGPVQGHLAFEGGFGLRDVASGAIGTTQNFEVHFTSEETEIGTSRDLLYLGEPGRTAAYELRFGKLIYQRADDLFRIYGFDVDLSADLAARLGRPELAGKSIAFGEIVAEIHLTGGARGDDPPPPDFNLGGFRDVKLGLLSGVNAVGRTGTYPNGDNALSMSTTSCNVGDVDIEWHAAMQEDHPGIVMSVYRELNGRFEQIGVSDVKHGFYALSSSQCTTCQHPSDGSFLGVGCSDTYGSGNNSDRQWLAPKDEWQSYPGTWECTGSHFAGGPSDCTRRHGGSGHGTLDHRLNVADADLDVAGATFYYEAYYVVRDDANKINNPGSKRMTASWTGSSWNISTPSTGNPLVEGPAVLRFGDLQTWRKVPAGPLPAGDGSVLLCAEATDLGGGVTHYEYALWNQDSDRAVRRFSVPLGGATSVVNIGFHDSDTNAGNDWTVTVAGAIVTWETTTTPLEYGRTINFRFDADAAPVEGSVELETWKPEPNDAYLTASWIPEGNAASVGDPAESTVLRLRNSPNPLTESTTIHFELAEASSVSLEIFTASGRKVRSLVDGTLEAGAHEILWDTRGTGGLDLGAGVYYYRLRAGSEVAVRSMVVH